MSHEPFERWLFAETLTPEQAQALQAHLQTCATCARLATAWQQAESLLHAAPRPAPAPGFTARWLARERAARRRQQRRATALAAGLAGLGLLGSALGLGLLWWQAPAATVAAFTALLARAASFGRVLSMVLDALAGAAPTALWALTALSALGWLLLTCLLGWSVWRWVFPVSLSPHGGER